MSFVAENPEVKSKLFEPSGNIPNNPDLPLVLYKQVFHVRPVPDPAGEIERVFEGNGWQGTWRWGIYDFHHYHAKAHEVLGCFKGSAQILFGGDDGWTVEMAAGDAVVIPAGVGHRYLKGSGDFAVVGAYPPGQHADMNYARKEELEPARQSIPDVPLPKADPVFGGRGKLLKLWQR